MHSYLSFRQRPNYLTNIVSVALVLTLLGLFALGLIHARQLVRLLKEEANVLMEIKPTATEMERAAVENYLVDATFVKEGSVTFTDKDTAAEMMSEQFGTELAVLDLPNPYYDVFTFNVKEDYFQREILDEIRTDLLQFAAVRDVYYQAQFLQLLGRNLYNISAILLGIGLVFLLITIVLIHHNIRMALYANRLIIRNMELVGASWHFISRPYLWRSAWHGLLSGSIAALLLLAVLYYCYQWLPELALLQHTTATIALLTALLLFGILISVVSTYYVVNKYLKLRADGW